MRWLCVANASFTLRTDWHKVIYQCSLPIKHILQWALCTATRQGFSVRLVWQIKFYLTYLHPFLLKIGVSTVCTVQCSAYAGVRVSSKQTKINFGSNRNKICFAFVSVFRTYIETTETNVTNRNIVQQSSYKNSYLRSFIHLVTVFGKYPIFLIPIHPKAWFRRKWRHKYIWYIFDPLKSRFTKIRPK